MKHNQVAFSLSGLRSAPVMFLIFLGLLFQLPLAARESDRLPVAASILPLANFCEQLGGERVRVQVLIPPGASPHVFEPAPSAVQAALQAKVFVYVGSGLEPWAERFLKAQPSPHRQVVEAVEGVELLQGKPHGNQEAGSKDVHPRHSHFSHNHVHFRGNPHVWLDPVLVQDLCRRITQALIKAAPEHRQYFESRLKNYLKELEALHQEISRTVAGFRIREFVSFHPAFSYFAKRYGLREVGVIAGAPGREPSPGHLQDLVTALKKYQVRAVFAEPQFSPRVAEVIAREAGVKVLLLDPLGGRAPYGTDYLKLMRHNLKVMAEAMQ